MKQATESQWQLVRLTRRLRHPSWLLIAPLLFIAIPGATAKLVACCLGITAVLMQRQRMALQAGWIFALTLAFAASFLLTPITGYLAKGSGALALAIGVCACGVVWLVIAMKAMPAPGPRPSPTLLPVFAAAWVGIVMVLLMPGYDASPAYRGDEVYHIMSAQMYRLHLQELLTAIWPAVAWGVWILAAAWCVWRKPGRSMIIAVVAGALLLSLVGAFTVYSNDLLNLELVRDRASRYPTAMAWLSGFLAEANLFEWRDYFYTDTSFYRLLTALTMSCLAFGLALDKRWRHHPLPVALAAAAILTVPNIHYHASLLYLDLPVVVATTLLLLDIRHLVRSEAQHLPANSSWWLLLLLGMFKESAAPILAVVLGARCLCQFWRCRTGAISCKRLVMQEILVALAALGPLMLYLAIRYQFGARAYGAEFGNLFDVGLWAKGLTAIGQQSGTILLAGIAGLWVLWRQHRRMEALLLVALFFGLKAFFLVDSDSYVGLARFNLYVLPPVLVLAWEAYTALFARRQVLALGAAAALLATNLAMSPVHLNGDRDSDYGESTEAWYPFDQVIQDLSLTTPQARIALANAEVDYSLNILTSQQHWGVDTRLLPPFSDNDSENLPRSLEAAEKQEVTVVIYRFEGLPASPPPATIGLWQLHSTASGTGGMLAVYSR